MTHSRPSPKPAQAQARACLATAVAECRAKGQHWLPGIRELSARGRCSQTTMTKAVAAFVSERVLATGKRMYLLPTGDAAFNSAATPMPATVAPEAPARLSRSRELADGLRADLTAGRFVAGADLPSVKELCVRHRTSYLPMRHALDSLCREGLIARHKRGFRTPDPPRAPEFWRVIERECGRRGVSLVIRSCDEAYADLAGGTARLPDKARNVIGYLVWIQGFTDERSARLADLLHWVNAPVAIMEEGGLGPLATFTRGNPLFRVFSIMVDSRPGMAVGRHLQALGHRHAACFSPVPMETDPFYRRHAEGLNTVFGRGSGMSLEYHAPRRYRSYEELIEAARAGGAAAAVEQTRARTLQSLVDTYHSDTVFALQHAPWHTITLFLQPWAEEEFRKVLDKRTATAWIGATDGMALLALNFLQRNKVAVPGEVSVSGFDNTVQSFVRGLSSYDFNMPAMVNALLDHILMPGRLRPRRALPPLWVPGSVVARSSTGAARGCARGGGALTVM